MNAPGLVDILEAIDSGHFDEKLDLLWEAIRQRKEQLRHQASHRALATYKVGARVRIINIRPKYLMGAAATIVGIKDNKFEVKLDGRYGRYSGIVTCPASCLRLEEED